MRHWNAIGPRDNAERDGRTLSPHAVDRGAMPPGSSISRSSFYYAPQGETEMNLALMQVIDQQFLETPFYGVRQMTWRLQKSEGPWPQWGRVSPKTAIL